VAASRAVHDLVQKLLDEKHETGSIELHYTPNNADQKPITIPLTTH